MDPEDRIQAVCTTDVLTETHAKCSLACFDNIATIGRGNFGHVQLVYHRDEHVFLAMKVLDSQDLKRRKQLKHVKNELAVLQLASKCPFLTSLYTSFTTPTHYYICLEYCPGGELFRLLRDLGRMNPLMSAFYAAEVVAGIEFLHLHNIIYRDLKPENVLIAKDGHIKLCDFGFSKTTEGKSWTLCGTPEYLAPEIILGTGHDKAVDWWALGVFIFELLAGYPPFHGNQALDTYDQILDGVFSFPSFFSSDSKDIIDRLLEPSKSRRLGNLVGGVEDIKKHAFFQSIDWVKLYQKEIDPPAVPTLEGDGDYSHFDLTDIDAVADGSKKPGLLSDW